MITDTCPVHEDPETLVNVKKIEPNVPMIFNLDRLIYDKGEDMEFFPGIREVMRKDFDECPNNRVDHFINNREDEIDYKEEEDWVTSILPGIIVDVFDYESSSVYARYPGETDEAYEQRLMFAMDINSAALDDFEAELDLFLAGMN